MVTVMEVGVGEGVLGASGAVMGAGVAEEVIVAVSSGGEMEVEGAEDPGGRAKVGWLGVGGVFLRFGT